ncbi:MULTISPECIES: DUF2790 domain-containing protein [Pseudomonas]|uniref:DUF2790 domain-containing protein n=1 Tax=Pseudomonas gingeri TaxID=117681 RepID=A0A7Y8BV31_9PSED|nr:MULTISPECIES: DUF2790 domain-containing protein [Pseudomonas]NWB88352.1 DUF2790 domain-containing protein [Pseudomonas gingeri]RBH60020.1 DUF2790 domain-containing protein [Pseudomonas sp. MWU13-2860]
MNFAKMALVLILGSAAAQAFADDGYSTAATSQLPVETYTAAAKPDIEKVIAITEAADQCAPVPVQMTYDDSHGQRHILQYDVMGSGCSNG